MFDLETAIQTWLHSLRLERALRDADIAELEDHVRDHVESLVSKGHTPESAFRESIMRLGGRLDIGHAYQDIYWNKVHQNGRWRSELQARLSITRHYLVIALRAVRRQKLQAGLNVLGLSLGFAACLIIGLYVHDELRFDDFNKLGDRVYRVASSWGGYPFATSTMRLGPAMQEDFLEIDSYVRVYKTEKLLQYGDERFQIKNVFYSDSTLWQVFDFDLLRGSTTEALKSPDAIVLTKSVADRLFGIEDPLGKQILVDNMWTGEVTGVVSDPPSQSHIQYQAFISMTTAEERLPPGLWQDWFWTGGYTYIALNPGVNVMQMSARLPEFREKHMGDTGRELGMHYDLFLEPLPDIYLHSRAAVPIGPMGSADRVRIFLSIGLLILLLAGFNFTNLATAGSISRAREIGVRKVVGAQNRQLTGQFLMESVVTCLISFVIALATVRLSMSFLSELSGKVLTISPL